MNTLDYVIITITIVFVVKGLFSGFISQLFSLLSVFLAVIVAYFFHNDATHFITDIIPEYAEYQFASFIILFILVFLVTMLIGKLFTKVTKVLSLGVLNRLLGGLMGFLTSIICYIAVTYLYDSIISAFEISESYLTTSSKLVSIFRQLLIILKPLLSL